MNDIVRNVHHIIDRTHPNQPKLILQPLRTLFYSNVFYSNTGISGTCFTVLYRYFYIEIVIFYCKSIDQRTFQRSLLAILNQVGIQVACHTIVRTGIRTIGRDIHFEYIITLYIIIIFGQCARNSLFGQDDDTIVRSPDTDFILCTDHTDRLYTTNF